MFSLKDPIPGYINSFNGPIGLLTAGGKGLVRVLYANKYTSQNDIPVDTVINTIILVSWKLGLTMYVKRICALNYKEKLFCFEIKFTLMLSSARVLFNRLRFLYQN